MKIITLASGSSGNCILISQGKAHLLVDCGVSGRRIEAGLLSLGVEPGKVLGICVTHEHSDHVSGLPALVRKYGLPVYTSPGTSLDLRRRVDLPAGILHDVEPGVPFRLGPFTIGSFPIPHDAAQPMGFTFSAGGKRAALCTDLGHVTEEVLDGVLGCELVICEANHDVNLLKAGPYPYPLKVRILGDYGHLSNEDGAALALKCAAAGAKTVVLAHLSQQNNTPARAMLVADTLFRRAGITPGVDVTLAVAPRERFSEEFTV